MSYDMLQEDVPLFQSRVGDYAVHGSNNSVLILGRDRAKNGPASVGDGLCDEKGAGSAHLVVGRSDKSGDPDFSKDSSFVYLSMKTRLDDNLNVKTKGTVVDNSVPAAVIKSDHVRVVTRKNIKVVMEDSKNFLFMDKDRLLISVGDGSNTVEVTKDKTTVRIDGGAYVTIEKSKIVVDGDRIELGKDATYHVLRGEPMKQLFLDHQHPTGVGLSGKPIQPWVDDQIFSQRAVFVD